jgi:transposase
MITIGVDFHKRTSSYKVLDENGQYLKKCKLVNDRETIRTFVESIPGPKQLAMEATRSWGLYYDSVQDLVDKFHLGHPLKMKAITESETKNDAQDADWIARLAHSGFFPHAHVPTLDIRQLRSLLRFRNFLVNQRRSIRNQVQTLIDRNLWVSERPTAFKNIFCRRGLTWLQNLNLAERERFILDRCLESYKELTDKIKQFESFIQTQTLDLSGLEHLRTVPGFRFSKVNTFIVLTEASDMNRFRKARSFAHYAGLIPSESSSGDKHRTGRLIKQANMHLRTAIIESTFAAIRADKGLQAYYKQVKARSGSGAAVIATARKLAYAIYAVLKEQRPYRPEKFNPPAAVCHS